MSCLIAVSLFAWGLWDSLTILFIMRAWIAPYKFWLSPTHRRNWRLKFSHAGSMWLSPDKNSGHHRFGWMSLVGNNPGWQHYCQLTHGNWKEVTPWLHEDRTTRSFTFGPLPGIALHVSSFFCFWFVSFCYNKVVIISTVLSWFRKSFW